MCALRMSCVAGLPSWPAPEKMWSSLRVQQAKPAFCFDSTLSPVTLTMLSYTAGLLPSLASFEEDEEVVAHPAVQASILETCRAAKRLADEDRLDAQASIELEVRPDPDGDQLNAQDSLELQANSYRVSSQGAMDDDDWTDRALSDKHEHKLGLNDNADGHADGGADAHASAHRYRPNACNPF